jgi:hypothetical protein
MKINIVVAHALIVLFFTLNITPIHRTAYQNSLNFGMAIPVEYIVPPLPIVKISIDNHISFDEFSFFKEPGETYKPVILHPHLQDISNPAPIEDLCRDMSWSITGFS